MFIFLLLCRYQFKNLWAEGQKKNSVHAITTSDIVLAYHRKLGLLLLLRMSGLFDPAANPASTSWSILPTMLRLSGHWGLWQERDHRYWRFWICSRWNPFVTLRCFEEGGFSEYHKSSLGQMWIYFCHARCFEKLHRPIEKSKYMWTVLNRCEYIDRRDLVVFILALQASQRLIIHLVTRLEIAKH